MKSHQADKEMGNENISLGIIEKWTEHYPPADSDEMFTLKLSSYEIAEILSDFGAIEAGEVTRILLQKGLSWCAPGMVISNG